METKIKLDVRIIKPNDGCLLTQSADVELQNRIFSDEIWLAATDSPDNWEDIPLDEAESIKKQQEELIANEQPTE